MTRGAKTEDQGDHDEGTNDEAELYEIEVD